MRLETHDIFLRPVGGLLALNHEPTEVWSTSPTEQLVNTWTEMFSFLYKPKERGKILWVEVYLKYRVKATTVTADVDERVRARNQLFTDGVYVNISDELATADIGQNWVTRITSGFILPITGGAGLGNFDEVPCEFQIQMRTNEADTGRLEVSSESFIRIVYEEI